MRKNIAWKQGVLTVGAVLAMMGSAREAGAVTWQKFIAAGTGHTAESVTNVPIGGNSLIAVYPDEVDTSEPDLAIITTSGSTNYLTTLVWLDGPHGYSPSWAQGEARVGVTSSVSTSGGTDLYSWTSVYEIYKNSDADDFGKPYYGGLVITDTSYDTGATFALESGTPCGGSGYPAGDCIVKYLSGTGSSAMWQTWKSPSSGAKQIVQQGGVATSAALVVVDSSGIAWQFPYSIGPWAKLLSGGPSSTQVACGTGAAFVIAQLQQYGTAYYALREGSSGTDVFVYDASGGCFEELASPPSGYTATWVSSITVPVSTSSSAPAYAESSSIWATATDGTIWYAN